MITETYREIEITLLEDENKWRFTANGRERTAPTLPKAREYIDNALGEIREKKTKPWEPFDVYVTTDYNGSKYTVAKVTSLAETTSYDGKREVWISVDGKRSKKNQSTLFELSDSNSAIIAELGGLVKQRGQLDERINRAKHTLLPIKWPEGVI